MEKCEANGTIRVLLAVGSADRKQLHPVFLHERRLLLSAEIARSARSATYAQSSGTAWLKCSRSPWNMRLPRSDLAASSLLAFGDETESKVVGGSRRSKSR